MKYIKYFWYVLKHKYYVFIECWQQKMYVHAFTHDLSKFLPLEFIAYANYWYGSAEYNDYLFAEKIHYLTNLHHWQSWVLENEDGSVTPLLIPLKYIKQMYCDWKAMARNGGSSVREYYENNKNKIVMHENSRKELEKLIYGK